MKLKLLLFLTMLAGILYAQEPYRNLVISEARMDAQDNNHVEFTNMGDQTINLSEFKFVLMRPWIPEPILDVWNDPWVSEGNRMFMLPDVELEPVNPMCLPAHTILDRKCTRDRLMVLKEASAPNKLTFMIWPIS